MKNVSGEMITTTASEGRKAYEKDAKRKKTSKYLTDVASMPCQDRAVDGGSPWVDKYKKSCKDYERDDWCVRYGAGNKNDGYCANEACCTCGGGAAARQQQQVNRESNNKGSSSQGRSSQRSSNRGSSKPHQPKQI